MATYHNVGFDDACDILSARQHRLASELIEQSADLTFEQDTDCLTAQLLGQSLEVAPATRSKLLSDTGLKACADALPPVMLTEALNHVFASRLRKTGSVKVWHDRHGRLIHLDWAFRERTLMTGVHAFRSAFHAIDMKHQHTRRRPSVLILEDLPTHVNVTADCDKVREVKFADAVLGGVMLRHSEMGATSTALYASLYRAFCRNQFIAGFSKSDPRYIGDLRIPVGLNDLASGLASSLGSLLNRVRRLANQSCLAMEAAVPILQCRWGLAEVTADSLLKMANDRYLTTTEDEAYLLHELMIDIGLEDDYTPRRDAPGCLYDVFNTFTAVTTHRRDRIPQGDCQVLERLSDALLTEENPLQRLLQHDLQPMQ